MRVDGQLRLAVGIGPACDGCALREVCGAAELDEACHAGWGEPARGGVNALHPWNPDTWEYFLEVGGADFDDIAARRQPKIELPVFTHRIRPRRALRGQLDEPVYLVGPDAVNRRRVLSCQRFRELTGLSAGQRVGLILFGKDKTLERLWARRLMLIPEIAKAGYDFCVPPSYSNYTDRPRPEFLYNAKRALEFFSLLQMHGVPAIPRVAWLIEYDARRFARWVNTNPAIEQIALDLSGSSRSGWLRELRLLSIFDQLTDQRLSYLVHGPSVAQRCLDLYQLLGVDRVHLTNTRAIARPPGPGMTYAQRFAREREQIDDARHRDRQSRMSITRAA